MKSAVSSKVFGCKNSKGSRESEVGGSGDSVPFLPITSNNAATNTIANANGISAATATVHATAIVAPLQSIITLPTTIATNTNLVLNHDYHIQSFYEYFLQS